MEKKIIAIRQNAEGQSLFREEWFALENRGGMWISEQLSTVNMRYRKSAAGYTSSWHVAGDPTLIVICCGCLRITLQNGQSRDFQAGDQFIAADFLPEGIDFDPTKHGHTAEVIGDTQLEAVHLKLAKR